MVCPGQERKLWMERVPALFACVRENHNTKGMQIKEFDGKSVRLFYCIPYLIWRKSEGFGSDKLMNNIEHKIKCEDCPCYL